MNLYIYKGPVLEFGKCVATEWRGATQAESMAKARCNLAYQFKRTTNRLPNTKITLPGEIVMEGA